MANQNKYKYVPIDPERWHIVVRPDNKEINLDKCCIYDNPDDPGGCDCCYDNWNDELKIKLKDFGKAVETANQAQAKLLFYRSRRDGLKQWLVDLDLLDDYTSEICDQFELIISQVEKICSSSVNTVRAIEILFCMVRDFYSQYDKIRIIYD